MPELSLFRDYYEIKKPSNEDVEKINDSVANLEQFKDKATKGLPVTFEATHSALFNDNLRFYLPGRMEDGTITFLGKNGKSVKILKHHDEHSDPVGIITGAKYVPTIPAFLKDDKNVKILTDNSFPLKTQLKAARDLLQSGVIFSDEWKGLGYIQLQGVVFDEKTVGQIKNGLFDAVSTSFRSPGKAYCSVCLQNLIRDGFCEHEPGQMYSDEEDGEPNIVCGIIPGVHNYDEVSFVVFDADPLTQVSIGHKDSKNNYEISVDDWKKSSKRNSSNFGFSFRDFKEDNNMADPAKTEKSLSDAAKEILAAIKQLRPELDDSKAEELAVKLEGMKDDDGKYPHQLDAEIDDDTALLYTLEHVETADQEIKGDEICDEMQVELKSMLDEELITKEEWEDADAKLSAGQRKKMSESTFCGPNRSFPVPDCAHVTAARRLIGRYKGPGSKSKILACVTRKAKSLGCDSKKKDKTEKQEPEVVFETPTCDQLKTIDDNATRELFNAVEAEMISRNLKLDRPCGKCAALEDEANKIRDSLKDSETKIEDLENTLNILREELRFQMNDYSAQVDKYIELSAKLKGMQKDHVVLVGTLSGKYESIEKAEDSLKDANIDKEFSAAKDFKVEDFLKKQNDGIANSEPQGTVDDPGFKDDVDNNALPDGLTPAAVASIENIRKYINVGQKRNAKSLYDKMVSLKVIDQKLVPFDSLSVKDESVTE
jgi:hypothetical protein